MSNTDGKHLPGSAPIMPIPMLSKEAVKSSSTECASQSVTSSLSREQLRPRPSPPSTPPSTLAANRPMSAFERAMQDARAKGLLGPNSRIGSPTVFTTGMNGRPSTSTSTSTSMSPLSSSPGTEWGPISPAKHSTALGDVIAAGNVRSPIPVSAPPVVTASPVQSSSLPISASPSTASASNSRDTVAKPPAPDSPCGYEMNLHPPMLTRTTSRESNASAGSGGATPSGIESTTGAGTGTGSTGGTEKRRRRRKSVPVTRELASVEEGLVALQLSPSTKAPSTFSASIAGIVGASQPFPSPGFLAPELVHAHAVHPHNHLCTPLMVIYHHYLFSWHRQGMLLLHHARKGRGLSQLPLPLEFLVRVRVIAQTPLEV
jgi:hypothetical protein